MVDFPKLATGKKLVQRSNPDPNIVIIDSIIVCLFVCLFVYLFVCLFVCLFLPVLCRPFQLKLLQSV